MPTIFSDLRYGVRLMLKSPGFACIAILALGLGIGANTAIFSLVDRVLIRPLPYADADRLVMVWEDASYISFPRNTPAVGNFVDWKQQNQVFTDMAAIRGSRFSLTGDGSPESVEGVAAAANLFDVLGVKPLLGRPFTDAEDQSGENVVLMSYGLWQSRYGHDPGIIGRNILMDGIKKTVIGVLPAGFTIPNSRQLQYVVPVHFSPQQWHNRGSHFLRVMARLKPGVTVARAQSDMSIIARRLEQQYPNANSHIGAVVVAVREQFVGKTGTALWVLLAAAGCVLLIACANVANLLLAKAAVREREMAIRSALGAARSRLIGQMVTESLLLSIAGGALGLLLASISARLLVSLIPVGLAASNVGIDGRLLLFNLAVSLLTGLVFGLAPALQLAGAGIVERLKEGGRAGVGGASRRFRDALVVAEVALALILLVSAGLLLQTLKNLHSIDAGFRPENILTLTTRLPSTKYRDPAKRVAYFDAVLSRVRALPGVESAGFTSNLPFTTAGNTNGFQVEGIQFPPGSGQDALYREVTNDFLQTMHIRLLEGRFFGSEDRADSLAVVIINETFKKQFWPRESALGKRIQTEGGNSPWQTIIGVVRDVRERGLELDMKPAVYLPVVQVPNGWNIPSQLAARTAMDPLAIAKAAREAVWAVDPDQPISDTGTMEDIVDLEVADHKQQTTLLGSFAALALVLASLGIYGVLSYMVTQRTREIGLRMALGASPGDVTGMVVRQGLALAALGIAIGLGVAFAVTRSMTKLLVGVQAGDPTIYGGVALLLAVVSMAACYLPAARASRVDPMIALRDE
ncbi:MAG TPA: ABC transporter permease [Bryobacteraceae bacterium]|nr:ABC transporter permease [Bryobacteraceae bacterium]